MHFLASHPGCWSHGETVPNTPFLSVRFGWWSYGFHRFLHPHSPILDAPTCQDQGVSLEGAGPRMPLPPLAADTRCELSTAELHTSVTPFGNSGVHPSYQQITVPAVETTYSTGSWSWKTSSSILLSLKKNLPTASTGTSVIPCLSLHLCFVP